MAYTDSDLKEFEDARLRVRVPAYLRRQGKAMLFVARESQEPGQSLLMLSAVSLQDRQQAQAVRQAMDIVKAGTWMGTEKSVIRRGAAAWLPNAYELLGTDKDATTGKVHHHDLTVLVDRGRQTVQVRLLGTGELARFEQLARALIEGMHIKED